MPPASHGDAPPLPVLYAAQRRRIGRVIDTELSRLARRRPEFSPEVLTDVHATLWRIARRLFLHPLASGRVAPALAAHLLALDDTSPGNPATPR